MKTQTLLVVMIGLLVLMGGLQAVQLTTVVNAIEEGGISSPVAVQTSGGAAKSSALSQLPTQVGGC